MAKDFTTGWCTMTAFCPASHEDKSTFGTCRIQRTYDYVIVLKYLAPSIVCSKLPSLIHDHLNSPWPGLAPRRSFQDSISLVNLSQTCTVSCKSSIVSDLIQHLHDLIRGFAGKQRAKEHVRKKYHNGDKATHKRGEESHKDKLIPKPKGRCGRSELNNGYSLIEAMGLVEQRPLYNALCVRDCLDRLAYKLTKQSGYRSQTYHEVSRHQSLPISAKR